MNFFLIHLLIATLPPFVLLAQVNDPLSRSDKQSLFPKECGTVKLKGRITGGIEASLGQFPWMATLAYQEKHKKPSFRCGGALLNQYYVLTAAHCIHGLENDLVFARLGENFVDTVNDCENGICAPPVQDMVIDKLMIHPNYSTITSKNDIALIRFQKPVQYNDFVSPICLPQGGMLKKSYISQMVEVAGWGVMDSSSEQIPSSLLFVRIPVTNSSVCDILLPEDKKIGSDNTQMCAGTETGEDSCSGDSGGPMMKAERYYGIKQYFIIGVVSFGKLYCGEAPSIYTNVIPFMDWILNTVQPDEKYNFRP